MGNEEEIDFTQAKPLNENAQKVIEKFCHPPGPEDVDALAEPGVKLTQQHKALTEELLSEYHLVSEMADVATKRKAELREAILQHLGKERGLICRGGYAVEAKDVAARKSVKWDKAVKEFLFEQFDKDGEEVFAPYLAKHTTEGEPSVRIDVKRIE